MSPICQTFVQNSWKSDLCSNCFRCKDDHESSGKQSYSNANYGSGSLSRRYVGVAGRSSYSRTYYGMNTWNSILDRDSDYLKSPGLIKGMDNLIKENEKNQQRKETQIEDKTDDYKNVNMSTKNIWLLSNYNSSLSSTRESLQKDDSIDLGSDAGSHDTSTSSSIDSTSLDYENPTKVETNLQDAIDSNINQVSRKEPLPVTVQGIMKSYEQRGNQKRSISFNNDEEVIGYGGDVDYSDDDSSFIDDDDNLSLNSCDLSSDERLLRRLTEKNTDFNSENENLIKIVNKSDNEGSEDSSSAREESKNRNPRVENKIKLKRSQPHVSVKPNIKPQIAITNETINSTKSIEALDMLLKGIKPKFVSKDEEMVENPVNSESEELTGLKRTTTKVTSIDDIIREALIAQVEKGEDQKVELQTGFSSDLMKCDDQVKTEVCQKPVRNVKPFANQKKNINTDPEELPFINNCSKQIDKGRVKSLTNNNNDKKQCENKTAIPQNLIQRRSSFMESQLGLEQTEVNQHNPKKVLHERKPNVDPSSLNIIPNKSMEPTNNCKKATKSDFSSLKDSPSSIVVKEILGDTAAIKYNSFSKKNDVIGNETKPATDTSSVPKKIIESTAEKVDKFSTFGPKIASANGPQSSFLHSDFLKNNGNVCSTTEFLQLISSPSDTVTQTAGIQKSALHNSTSSVKELLTTKPFLSQKATNSKDKPAIPPKIGIKFNRGRPVSTPVVNKPEITNASESWNKHTDVIYAVPTLAPTCAISPTSSSSGYSTTSNVSFLSNKDGNETVRENIEVSRTEAIFPETVYSTEQEATQPTSYTTESLDNSSQQTLKRAAPQPPFEDVPLNDYQPPINIKVSPENEQILRCQEPHGLQLPISDSQEFDSYSSFTDDFDDDDEDYPQQNCEASKTINRSCSVTPIFRNSMATMENQQNTVSFKPTEMASRSEDGAVKYPATRSYSVPRSVESSVKAVQLDKKKSESSRFGFVKATFFRPSSPPSMKRKMSFDRSRDRSKKSGSGFSFKKFLRLGSSDKSKQNKSQKVQEKQAEREIKKQKLQIVHPLDYNKTGVEVIARPEPTSPIYSCVPQMYSPSIPNSVISVTASIIDNLPKNDPKDTETPTEDCSAPKQVIPQINSFGLLPQTNNSLSATLHKEESSEIITEKKSSFLKKKSKPERRNSSSLPPTGLSERSASNLQFSNSKLGCNSEGRPKPPPPPRKTSLEVSSDSSSHGEDRISEISSRHSSDSESSLRRQCPPRRITSSSIQNHLKPSLYANLGDVRAPFTPRKPLRSSSIKDMDKEKRKAPLPPRHSSKNKLHGIEAKNQYIKGNAPPVPTINYSSNGSQSHTDSSSDVEKTNSQTSRTSSLPNLSDLNADLLAHSNFESLSNLLDEVSSSNFSKTVNSALCHISSWKQLELITADPTFCGPRVFYDGRMSGSKVVVMFSSENKMEVDPLLMPVPLHMFKEEVPASLFGGRRKSGANYVQASIWILPNMSLSSLAEFSHFSQRVLERDPLKWEKRICLLLLQLVTALKHLQAKGIEETSLERLLISELFAEDGDRSISSRLMLISPSAEHSNHLSNGISLCQCAAEVTMLLLGNGSSCGTYQNAPVLSPPFTPRPHAFVSFVATLREERASSLTKAKCILEAMLYGPTDVKVFADNVSDELIQAWLDNERTNLLTHIRNFNTAENFLTLLIKFQLFFLVRTNTKCLRESLFALEAPDVTSF